jgi:hypothetical protein
MDVYRYITFSATVIKKYCNIQNSLSNKRLCNSQKYTQLLLRLISESTKKIKYMIYDL